MSRHRKRKPLTLGQALGWAFGSSLAVLLLAPIPFWVAALMAAAVTPGWLVVWVSVAIAAGTSTGPGTRARTGRMLAQTEQILKIDGMGGSCDD